MNEDHAVLESSAERVAGAADLASEVAGLFPGAAGSVYLSTCTRGLLPRVARRALDAQLDALETGGTDKVALFEMIEDVRAVFAGMVNADPEEIAFTKNVSEGLNIVAASLDMKPGSNVVVTLDLEHPNNVYPWLNQRAGRGVEVRSIAARDGHVDVDAMLAAIDDGTRLVTVPTVSFSPGFRTDVARLGAACRARGVFLLVDAVQSCGVLHTDVQAMQVDGLATSTQKGLCGLYGMGFLYCRREWAEQMRPAYLARFGVNLGEGAHEAAMGGTSYRLMPAARRFDLGNYNFPAAAAAQASLKLLSEVGTRRIEQHVLALGRRLADGLVDLDQPVAGGRAGPHTSHIVCMGRMSAEHDSTDDAASAALSEHLGRHDVIHTIRRGMLRFALHLYNSRDDVDRVLDLVDGWRGRPAGGPALR